MIRVLVPASDDPGAGAGEHLAGRRRGPTVAIAGQEPEPGDAFAEVYEQVTGLLGGPRAGGVGGAAQDVHAAGLDLHHEQDVPALQERRVNVAEVGCEDPGGLGGQELPPAR